MTMKTLAAMLAVASLATAAPSPYYPIYARQDSNSSSSAVPVASSSSATPIASSSSAAVTVSSTSSSPPAATTTWHADVLVGQTSFTIGDADSTQFENLWKNVCHDNGCDSGSPPSFTFQTADGGDTTGSAEGTGTFNMEGTVDSDMDLMDWMLDSLNAAVLKTIKCNEVKYSDCIPSGWIGPPTCTYETMNVCTMVNFAQITMYDDSHNEVAQVKMSGSSHLDETGFDCGSAKTDIDDALGAFSGNPAATGILAVFNVICDAGGS